ncbi:hypothetical protein [Dyadobacter crusticola]|uniref:hypothetical protein n=1 Tax=Dyadobacter crusticola TaxID=292407 RepID=UPI0004E10640|nr:hypothetical protein [Dyadobacter crusticola]
MEVSPFFTACWTGLGGIVYVAVLIFQCRREQINSLDFGASCFQFLSLLNGSKQIIGVYQYYYSYAKTFELDRLYLAYGGLCVMWIAYIGLKKRFAFAMAAKE